MDRIFLDANVLFSAAWREESALRRLWSLTGVVLLTSTYAVEEARINLQDAGQRARLARLLEHVKVIPAFHSIELPAGLTPAEKDLPILSGAVQAGASHLITGDKQRFGPYFGRKLAGVSVLPPAECLRRR